MTDKYKVELLVEMLVEAYTPDEAGWIAEDDIKENISDVTYVSSREVELIGE